MRFALLFAAALLAGCAHGTISYSHPTKTQTDLDADSARCEALSLGIQVPGGDYYGFAGDSFTDGYLRGQAIGGGIRAAKAQARIYDRCMSGAGWKLAD